MEDLGGLAAGCGRPIKLFHPSDWAWVSLRCAPFILFVAARASTDAEVGLRRFAVEEPWLADVRRLVAGQEVRHRSGTRPHELHESQPGLARGKSAALRVARPGECARLGSNQRPR